MAEKALVAEAMKNIYSVLESFSLEIDTDANRTDLCLYWLFMGFLYIDLKLQIVF